MAIADQGEKKREEKRRAEGGRKGKRRQRRRQRREARMQKKVNEIARAKRKWHEHEGSVCLFVLCVGQSVCSVWFAQR